MEQFDVYANDELTLPLEKTIKTETFDSEFILSVPHAGTLVPKKMIGDLDDVDLLIEIDMHSDKVFDLKRGIRISSLLAPFVIDMNRAKEGSKDAPNHLRNDPLNYITIYDKPILRTEPDRSLIKYYDMYHDEIRKAIGIMKKKHGYALVIDGHSMTSVGLRGSIDQGKARADFVIGTIDGTSAHPKIIGAFKDELEKKAGEIGLRVAVDKPYNGGFITRKHSKDAHVIQLEVSMDTYMYEGFIDDRSKRYKLKPHKHIKSAIMSAIEKAIVAAKSLKEVNT